MIADAALPSTRPIARIERPSLRRSATFSRLVSEGSPADTDFVTTVRVGVGSEVMGFVAVSPVTQCTRRPSRQNLESSDQ